MTSSSHAPVGYIGLGNMGSPMARRLLDWPGGLVVFDVRPESLERIVHKGATAAASTAELAAVARVISVTVLNDAQVEDVVAGPGGIFENASAGTVVAIHSTIDAATAVSLAERGLERGIHVVDAPVSGGAAAAKDGRLALMVGASDEAFALLSEPFALFSDLIVHAGPVGAGTRMKLARNLLHFISFTAATEASRLAEAAGIDLVELGKVVRHSDAITGGAGAIMHRDTTAPIAHDDGWYAPFAHARSLGEKDLTLALKLGDELGVDLPLGREALVGLARGLGIEPGPLAEEFAQRRNADVR